MPIATHSLGKEGETLRGERLVRGSARLKRKRGGGAGSMFISPINTGNLFGHLLQKKRGGSRTSPSRFTKEKKTKLDISLKGTQPALIGQQGGEAATRTASELGLAARQEGHHLESLSEKKKKGKGTDP